MRRRSGILGILLLASVVACESLSGPTPAAPTPTDPYPLPSGPGASQTNVATLGDAHTVVLLYIEVRPGDRLELINAEAIGSLDGASTRFFATRSHLQADGDYPIGDLFEPIEGAVATADADADVALNNIGVALELTAHRPGRFEVTNVRLRYSLNGGPIRTGTGIDVTWIVCADDPAPAECS